MLKDKLISISRRIEKLFVPTSVVAGLQISDYSIKYIELRADGSAMPQTVADKSLRLPPGLIEKGRIKDRAAFLSALNFLKHQAAPSSKRKPNVILTISSADVYVQMFSIPNLSGRALEDAIQLNLEVISPSPIAKTYHSWKILNAEEKDRKQIEILGVFAPREIVDDLISVVEDAGFGVAAIEFSNLSLVRILNSLKVIEDTKSYLLIKLTQDGLAFTIVKSGELYFSYFHPWDKTDYEKDNISVEAVLRIIRTESQRVLDFYYSHYGGQIKDIVVITDVLSDQIGSFIVAEYPSFELTLVDSVKENFHGARGAALRGLIPRTQDDDINLMGPKVIDAFWRDQIVAFISIWRDAIMVVVIFILTVFIASDFFLINQVKKIGEIANLNLGRSEISELTVLQAKISEFNSQVAVASQADALTNDVAPFIKKINLVASGSGVEIYRFGFRADTLDASLLGAAVTQDKVIDFKNKLIALTDVYEVSLPLSGILPDPNRGFSFNMTFKIKSLENF